jgi:glycosyltransferase involved in cell wall biosynthesis
MKLTVVVTTYESPAYLAKVLRGYLGQTRPPAELVVADDGSGSETRELVERFARAASFPLVHARQEDEGPRPARARNLATRRSSGDYLVFTDGDCVPGPRFVADHARLARRGSFVQGKRILVEARAVEGFTGRESTADLLRLWLKGGIRKPHLLLRVPGLAVGKTGPRGVRGCNMAVFREDLYRVNGWNERFIGCWREDSELAVRLERSGCRRRDALFSAVVFHLHHDASDRGRREENDRLLARASEEPVFCEEGLVKRGADGPDRPARRPDA